MNENDRRSWPNRPLEDRGDEALRDNVMVRSIMDRLDQLERETRPSGGAVTSRDKDLKSREAISWAGYLIRILAGWAIEHQQGLAIGGLKSSGGPTPEMMKDPAYLDEKAALDSHVSERIGGKVNHRGQELPPERQREFSVQMAELLRCIFPDSLAEALRALEFGEVQPILQKSNVEGQKRNYSEKIMQLRALEYIEYEHAKGSLKGIAQKVVQNHFGVGVEAIRKWEGSLHKELGRRFVFLALSIARWDGNLVKGIRMGPDADNFQDFTEARYLNRMKLAGDGFRKSLKKKQERR